MTVFVTGATGYIGRGVVRELVAAGHEVVGLTRSEEKTSLLESLGARPVVGSLQDPASYRDEAAEADALVHLAAEDGEGRAAADRAAVETLLAAAASGRAQTLVYTSGCFILGETGGEPAHEDASVDDAPDYVAWRVPHERRVLAADGAGLAASVIRPGMVYGGRGGTFAMLFESAREDGAVRIVGDGENRWSPVYRGDVARLYRQVVERGGRGIFHCAEPAARVRELAVAASLAAGAEGATAVEPVDQARRELGAFADALTMDQVLGCDRARAFGWEPEHPRFLKSAESVYREWVSPPPSGS